VPRIGASVFTFATAKFAYLNTASVARFPATAITSHRRRPATSRLEPIAMPISQLKTTEPRISGT